MKKSLLAILIILTFACSNKNNTEKEITLTIKENHSNHNPIGNAIEVTFKNNSKSNSYIWLMTCDFTENFTTNNKNITLPNIKCAKNILTQILLKPSGEKTITLYAIYRFGLPEQKFRMGFFHVNDLDGENYTEEKYHEERNNKKTIKIIWSNQLTL